MATVQCPSCGGDVSLIGGSDRVPIRVMSCRHCGKTLEEAQDAAQRLSDACPKCNRVSEPLTEEVTTLVIVPLRIARPPQPPRMPLCT